MTQSFLSCDREQELLLPPSLWEWLPLGHLAWFVIDAVERLDLSAFRARYRADGHGRPAHDPGMMVALVLYSYAVGERSSRAIERRCVEDVAFRVVAANRAPDHTTIARFRVRHEEELSGLFSQVLGLCARSGLVNVGVIAVDGTKLHASASGHQNFDYDRIAREVLADAARIDAEEDELYGAARGDELPPELADPVSRRARLDEAMRQLEEEHAAEVAEAEAHNAGVAEYRAKDPKPKGRPPKLQEVPEAPSGRVNVTDPDSRPVNTHRGFIQGYNAQAVTTADQVVIAAELIARSGDGGLLEPMIDTATSELEAAGVTEAPGVVLADAGYWNAAQITALTDQGIDALVTPDGNIGRPSTGRKSQLAEAMRQRLATDEDRALYRRRQQIIEPVFAQTKVTRRADRFQRRGMAACRSEWRLITATHNLLKLWRATNAPQTA